MTTPTPWDSRTLRTSFATGDEMVVQPAAAGSDFVRLPWSVLEDLIDAAGGLGQSDVDGRIAAWARITPVGDGARQLASPMLTSPAIPSWAITHCWQGLRSLGSSAALDPVAAQDFVTKALRRRQLCHERRVYAADWQRRAVNIVRRKRRLVSAPV